MKHDTDEIRREVAEILGISAERVSDDLSAGSIPEWDSLAQMAIMTTLEEKYGLHIPEEQLMGVNSVAAILSLFEERDAALEPRSSTCRPQSTAVPSSGTASEDIPYATQTLTKTLLQRAELHPQKAAAVFDTGEQLTYGELARGMSGAADWLRKQGIRAGDTVGLYAEKKPEFFILYFGAQLCGAAVLNMDPGIKETRHRIIMSQVHPKLTIGTGLHAEMSWKDVQIPRKDVSVDPDTISRDRVAEIMFTTGTTGIPKGVQLTHANLAASAAHINAFLQTRSDDTDLVALPVHHSFGMGRVRCMLAVGGTAVMAPGFSNLTKLKELMQTYGVSGMAFVPAAWSYIVRSGAAETIARSSQLRYIEIGGASLSLVARKQIAELFPGTRICLHYGLTEASRSTFIELHSDREHGDSVGRPCDGVEVGIYDEHGKLLCPGEEGEICIRGPHVMKGYLHTPRQDVFYGDFFRSGDFGRMDAQGYVYLSGRIKDMINVGSEKVSPEEVEKVLETIPGVAEAACVPAPDPQGILGEVVKAVLVAEPTGARRPSDTEIQTAAEQRLERCKVPQIIEWRSKLERTSSGKLQRKLMR